MTIERFLTKVGNTPDHRGRYCISIYNGVDNDHYYYTKEQIKVVSLLSGLNPEMEINENCEVYKPGIGYISILDDGRIGELKRIVSYRFKDMSEVLFDNAI